MAPSERRYEANSELDAQNYTLFKDCLASRVLFSLSSQHSSNSSNGGLSADDLSDSEDLQDFSGYLASIAWPSLPESIRMLSHDSAKATGEPDVDEVSLDTLPPSFEDNLVSYSLVSPEEDGVDAAETFLRKTLSAYVPLALTPPPVWSNTRTHECEICDREVPLTYHHLVPRSTHARALKRGWHKEEMLNSVAWLCRPCHSVVHNVASNEDLARDFFTVERLLAREDVQRWRKYAAKQRWGARRG
ncbi:hypothetical protein M0805_009062 [Coniferiporia weirii]|nr:hypothetical protein M0805_009062 [Coniferiporia weirii]